MKKNWKYEIARDSMAFGSILFYLIVIIRAIIGEYTPFVLQLLIALIIIIILSLIIKNTNQYLARAFVVLVFTSLFYKDALFTYFAAFLWIFMIVSSLYLKINKKSIVRGIILGIISAIVSYYITLLII